MCSTRRRHGSYFWVLLISMTYLGSNGKNNQLGDRLSSVNDNCDFNDNLRPTCHWHNIGSELNFVRQTGSTMSHSTGPEGDYSRYQNGSYLYLEASNAKFGSKAQMTSKLFKPTIGRTLKFHVYMYGATVNYLKVSIHKQNKEIDELWKMSGNQGQKWIKVELRIVSLIPYKVTFEAAVGRNFQSDIAIDDVMFIDDETPARGWSQWNSWTTCQIKDHWCRKERFRLCIDKTFCEVKDTNRERQVASCDRSFCRVDGHWSSWTSWSTCMPHCGSGKRWRSRQCNEPAPQFGGRRCNGQDAESIPCWSGFCNSGQDDCDFDEDTNPFCSWKNGNETIKFQRKYLWTGTAGTGPPGDHSNNTHGKYIYLETSLPAKHGQHARMISRNMEPTKSRTLKFYTYMYGRSVNYLRVLINTENVTREIWRLEGDQGKQWILGRVDYSCPVSYQIIFEAGVGRNFQSDIAIDTIHFEENETPIKAGNSKRHHQKSNCHGLAFSKILLHTFLLLTFILFQLIM